MILLDGKETSARIRAELKDEVAELAQWHGRAPGLAVILVGQDPASQVYVRNKIRASEEVGIRSFHNLLPATTSQAELSGLIQDLNGREDVDGILLQLPLPTGLNSQPCLELIRPDKDVDGFHPVNMGRLTLGLPGLRPCTPAGVMALLNRYSLSPAGLNAVVVGRSNIVGKPLALMLAQPGRDANATVTVCHSGTRDLAEECRRADFLFLAMGSPRCVTRDMVKPGAVIVDIGMNRTPEGKLCGDCDFEDVRDIVSAITPVPGGVGPMTIAQLMANTVEAYKMHVSR